jgi:hypothetical protein
LTLPFGTTSSIACGESKPRLHLRHDVPRIDRQRDRASRRGRAFPQRATARDQASSEQPMRAQSAAARPIRIIGPVTNALHPSVTARSNAPTISSML